MAGAFGGWTLNFPGQIEPFDVRPPGVEIIDHELHHEVFSPFLLVVVLKDESAGTGLEDRHVSVEKFLEAQASRRSFWRRRSLLRAGMGGRCSVPVGICFIAAG